MNFWCTYVSMGGRGQLRGGSESDPWTRKRLKWAIFFSENFFGGKCVLRDSFLRRKNILGFNRVKMGSWMIFFFLNSWLQGVIKKFLPFSFFFWFCGGKTRQKVWSRIFPFSAFPHSTVHPERKREMKLPGFEFVISVISHLLPSPDN